MTIFAIQMMALGNTCLSISPYTADVLTRALICLFRNRIYHYSRILVSRLTILVGLLNISGGIVSLWKTPPLFQKRKKTRSHPIPFNETVYNPANPGVIVSPFGISMLVSNLLPGIIVGIILTVNGAVLLYLLTILIQLDKLMEKLA